MTSKVYLFHLKFSKWFNIVSHVRFYMEILELKSLLSFPVSVSVPSLVSNETTLCPGPHVKFRNNSQNTLNCYQIFHVVETNLVSWEAQSVVSTQH